MMLHVPFEQLIPIFLTVRELANDSLSWRSAGIVTIWVCALTGVRSVSAPRIRALSRSDRGVTSNPLSIVKSSPAVAELMPVAKTMAAAEANVLKSISYSL